MTEPQSTLSGGPPAPQAPAGAAPGPQRHPTGPHGGGAQEHRDNLALLKGLFLAVLVTALLYEVFPLPFIDQQRVLLLFDNLVSELIVGLTLWSLFILLFKALDYRRQARARQAFDAPAVRELLGAGVYARNAADVLDELRARLAQRKLKRLEETVAFRRVARVLQYIRSVPKKESINDLLDYQAQIDVKKLESSYTVLQVFIWAIPILGFIGTVLGIGEAVNEFAGFIQTAEGGAQFGAQMRAALGGVTSGLAVAFNTTFLALVLVIPVMIATSFLQKQEEENLLAIEEFCLEKLLPHLHVTPADDLHESYDEHLHRIMQLSQTWLSQFEPLVRNVARHSEMLSHQLAGVEPLVKEFTDSLLAPARGGPAEDAPAGEGAARPSAGAADPDAAKDA